VEAGLARVRVMRGPVQVFDGAVSPDYKIHLTVGDCVSQWDSTSHRWVHRFRVRLYCGRPAVQFRDGRIEAIKPV